jgi:hypothetical protein
MPCSITLVYAYRAFVQIKTEMRHVRFESFTRELSRDVVYDVVDTENGNVYHVKEQDLIGYHIQNIRVLEKSA